MDPASPPLPMPRYRLFQPDAGSHTSNSTWESLDGWITPWTRQNSGRVLKGASTRSLTGAPGGTNPPATTFRAEVISASGSFRPANPSQGAASKGTVTAETHTIER